LKKLEQIHLRNYDAMTERIRLNKAMAMLGICSRRTADKLIQSGSVFVDGISVKDLGTRVDPCATISVNSKQYSLQNRPKRRVWLYYKPVGVITTHYDPQHRKTVFEDIADKIPENVISIGRLDNNSEGLLLLTNSGQFARYAELPQTAWERRYKVRLFGKLDLGIFQEIATGVTIDRVQYATIKATLLHHAEGQNFWIECVLTEGRNREIRKVFNHFGLKVNRLIRTQYGPYLLLDLKPGEIREVPV
jgi:23S rRNA pseudouridine2605 synthase